MKRLGLLTVLLAGLMSFSLMIGCSGSDSGTGGDLEPGDTSDAAFQLAQELVGDEGEILDFADDVDLSFELFEEATGIFGPAAAAGHGSRIANVSSAVDSVTNIVITDWQFTADNWFVCTFSATQYQTECDDFGCDQVSVALAGTDSLQLLMLGDPLDTSQMVNGFNEVRARARSAAKARWVRSTPPPTAG